MIKEIQVNPIPMTYGDTPSGNKSLMTSIKKIIEEVLISENLSKVRVFNINHEMHDHAVGSLEDRRLVIFCNSTWHEAAESVDGKLQPYGKNTTLLTNQEGEIVAEYFPELFQINILYNIFEKNRQSALDEFAYIMTQFDDEVLKKLKYEFSWKNTLNKTNLIKTITRGLNLNNQAIINERKKQLEECERNICNYKENIMLALKKRDVAFAEVNALEEKLENPSDFVINELNNIIANKKVVDLVVKNNKLTVKTMPLIIHNNNELYYGGTYQIEINLNNAEIRFYNAKSYQSYWSAKDPHPHVSGNSNKACLGSAEATLAELAHQQQFYAMVMVCIDFLESVNTHDAAGKNVINWPRCKADGTLLTAEELAGIGHAECEGCGRLVPGDSLHTAYDSVAEYADGDGNIRQELEDEIHVCLDCLNEEYEFDDELNEYIRN